MEQRKKIEALVLECIRQGKEPRCELLWLKEKYERFAQKKGTQGKAQTDALIYKGMYGSAPERESHVMKIRFWRTGRHIPANREQCILFGRALELSESEMKYLLQVYYNHSDRVFMNSGAGWETDKVYQERKMLMADLVEEYLCKIPPSQMLELNIVPNELYQHLRHLYFVDAVKCIDVWKKFDTRLLRQHINSINYRSELERSLALLGEIPRKTMLRHLILFGKPFINRKIIDERLDKLGYLPLTEGHSMVSGERLDDLVIGFLKLYEENCTGKGAQECEKWICSNLRLLDRILIREGKQDLRFMYFKLLKDYSSVGKKR